MFGSRTAFGVGCCTLVLAAAFGCGGTVVRGGGGNDDDVAGGGSGGAPVGRAGSSSGGSRAGSSGAPSTGASAGMAAQGGRGGSPEPDPVQSGCPTEDLPPPDLECDPFTPGSCGAGSGCYPFVEHPEGSGCDQQHYGAACAPAGQRTQGELCGGDTGDWCAPGFVCVVGQRAGKRCAQLCKPGGSNQCSGGLLCGDLDVAGFGVCG